MRGILTKSNQCQERLFSPKQTPKTCIPQARPITSGSVPLRKKGQDMNWRSLTLLVWPLLFVPQQALATDQVEELQLKLRIKTLESMLIGHTDDDKFRVKRNISHETAECSFYFSLVAERTKDMDDTLTAIAEQNSDILLNHAFTLEDPEVFTAIYEMVAKDIGNDLKSNWDRFPIVINKYGENCQDLVERPHKRFLFWMKKEGLSMQAMTEEDLVRIFEKTNGEDQ
jgi:hypothetical protein